MTGEMEDFFARLQEQAKLRKDSQESAMDDLLQTGNPDKPMGRYPVHGPRRPPAMCRKFHLKHQTASGYMVCNVCNRLSMRTRRRERRLGIRAKLPSGAA